MKKIFMLAAAAATLFAVSCNRAQAPEALVEEDNSPVAVRFGSNLAATVTKAAVDEFTGEETLYIYAKGWKVGENLKLDPTSTFVFIDDVDASSPAPAPGSTDPVLEGEIDVWDPTYTDPVPFFYGNSRELYRFYAYYVGDAFGTQEKPALSADATIEVPFDGTQDIMLATTDIEADNTAGLAPTIIYSAKAARQGIQPKLVFEHQLSRFVFLLQFRPTDRTAEAENMTISSITLDSPFSTVTLDIDGEPTDNVNEWDQRPKATFGDGKIPESHANWAVFTLCDENGEPYSGSVDTTPFKDDQDNYKAPFGESIMVAPGASVYHMVMNYDYVYNGTPLDNLTPFEWDINLPELIPNADEDYVAEAGKKYIVKLVVYGPEKVDISVELTEWDEVELDEIDPDDNKYDPQV